MEIQSWLIQIWFLGYVKDFEPKNPRPAKRLGPFGLLNIFLKTISYPVQAICDEYTQNLVCRIPDNPQQWHIVILENLTNTLSHDNTKRVVIYVASTIHQNYTPLMFCCFLSQFHLFPVYGMALSNGYVLNPP